jgi:hypothetical protein
MTIDERRCQVLVAIQQALLGEIDRSLRAVIAAWGQSDIHLRFFFDRAITDDDRESVALVETEIYATMPEGETVRSELIHLPEDNLIPKEHTWVYFRKEAESPT